MTFQRMQVGQYFVEGDDQRAKVVERRIGRDYVIMSFHETVPPTKSAFDRAVEWVNNLSPIPVNLSKPKIHVVWFELTPAGKPNQWRSDCPTCKTGLLVCQRNNEGVLVAEDRCNLCGQTVIYDDLEDMRRKDKKHVR